MNTLATAAHPDAFAPEAAPTIADLGPGFHLIPVRDHCRITSARWRVRVTVFDCDVIDYAHGPEVRHYKAFNETLHFEDFAAAKRFCDRINADDRGEPWPYQDRAEILPPIRRREPRTAVWASRNCDPMALQAIAILRGALADLREAA